MRSERFKETEKMLFDYPYTKTQIQLDEAYLKDMSMLDPDEVEKIRDLKLKIAQDKRTVRAIEQIYDLMDDDEKTLIRLHYFQKLKDKHVAIEIGVSNATYYRMKGRIIDRFGLIMNI